MNIPSDEEWLAGLSPEMNAKASGMIEELAGLNADSPLSWVRSELSEDIPQTARFLFLSAVRSRTLDRFLFASHPAASLPRTLDPMRIINEGNEAFHRLVAAGANVDDLLRISRSATFRTLDAVVNTIDDGGNEDASENAPGWAMIETVNYEPTGRSLAGLHENLISVFDGDEALQG